MEIVLVFVVLSIGSLVQSTTGFGFGLVTIGFLIEILDIEAAVVVQMFTGFALKSITIFRLWDHVAWDRIRFLLPSLVVTVPLGLFMFLNFNIDVLRLILGIVLILAVSYQLIPRLPKRQWHIAYIGIPCGMFSGILSGAFGTGGPPTVAFVSNQWLDKYKYVATIQMVFLCSVVVRICSMLILSGEGIYLFTRPIVLMIIIGIIAIFIGSKIGLYLLSKISDKTLRFSVYIILFVLGIRYIVTYYV